MRSGRHNLRCYRWASRSSKARNHKCLRQNCCNCCIMIYHDMSWLADLSPAGIRPYWELGTEHVPATVRWRCFLRKLPPISLCRQSIWARSNSGRRCKQSNLQKSQILNARYVCTMTMWHITSGKRWKWRELRREYRKRYMERLNINFEKMPLYFQIHIIVYN